MLWLLSDSRTAIQAWEERIRHKAEQRQETVTKLDLLDQIILAQPPLKLTFLCISELGNQGFHFSISGKFACPTETHHASIRQKKLHEAGCSSAWLQFQPSRAKVRGILSSKSA